MEKHGVDIDGMRMRDHATEPCAHALDQNAIVDGPAMEATAEARDRA